MEPEQKFTVPGPPSEPLPEVLASKEVAGFENDERSMWLGKTPKVIFHGFRVLLFAFALGVNFWWDRNVVAMVWQSGRAGSQYHLSDSVLVALVTTSVANFLALIFIIAKHLFPSNK
jgi:hypothetical protein